MNKVFIEKLVSINEFSLNYYIADISIGLENNLWVLLQKKKTPTSDPKYDYRNLEDSYILYSIKNGVMEKYFAIENYKVDFHFVREIDQEQILLASARCQYFSESNIEKNAIIFSKSGVVKNTLTLGDGIQDIKVSKNKELWTSYFDEGVFGNYGWEVPLGQSGLRCWTLNGDTVYDYESVDYDHSISDCYAMNIDSQENVWFYFYTEFYLGKYSNGTLNYYSIDVGGASVLAIDNQWLVTDAGYSNRNLLLLHEIRNDRVIKTCEFELLDRITGESLEISNVQFFKDIIAFISQQNVYMINVRELKTELNDI
ncbi:hypothetical protein [Fusibacter sp. JL216-2]|uniref:hypothetical protein n=1 Tax=Fusibacter sp. JL216-2 TaxID=3071453 RepID=UPI003D33FD10